MWDIIWGLLTDNWELVVVGLLGLGAVSGWIVEHKMIAKAAKDVLRAALDAVEEDSPGGVKVTKEELREIIYSAKTFWQVVKNIRKKGRK